jgi:hypothetical protein
MNRAFTEENNTVAQVGELSETGPHRPDDGAPTRILSFDSIAWPTTVVRGLGGIQPTTMTDPPAASRHGIATNYALSWLC